MQFLGKPAALRHRMLPAVQALHARGMLSVFRREIGWEMLLDFLIADGDDSKEASCAIPQKEKQLLGPIYIFKTQGHKQENHGLSYLNNRVLPSSMTEEQQDAEEEYMPFDKNNENILTEDLMSDW
jgi:hypothetical protein